MVLRSDDFLVILSADGYNLRLVLAWLRMILRVVLVALLQIFAMQPAFKDHPKTEPANGILGLATSLRSPPWCVGSKRVIRIAGIHKIGTGGAQ